MATGFVQRISVLEQVEAQWGEVGRAAVERTAVEQAAAGQPEIEQVESDMQATHWQYTSDQTRGSLASYPAPPGPPQT